MFDWIAPLFGRKVVWLMDFDGEVNKRWAYKTPFGFVCNRKGFVLRRPCLLLEDGRVSGVSYVSEWREP